MNKPSSSLWKDKIRDILLAGLGAMVMAEEEAEKFIRRAVNQGALEENEGQEILRDLLKKKKKESPDFDSHLKSQLRTQIESLDLPTREDIQKINLLLNKLLTRLSHNGTGTE